MLFRRRRNTEAAEALEDARKNLKKVQSRGGEVSRVAKALKDIRDRNHFAEALEAIIASRGSTK